ncbi:hypothetical protein QN395_10585 [Undibacterium sp. RTI2.2]|nr:hypothetical protein [Undibacterium sp. RTI2.2]
MNIKQLAEALAREIHNSMDSIDKYYKAIHEFQYTKAEDFKNGFPTNCLQFIPFPGRSNKRMQRQLGCFIYDTLCYGNMGLVDLEDYIEKKVETSFFNGVETRPGKPILTKIFINQAATSDVFTRLELMNITGGNLYDSADGVALDVKNAYNYNPKFSYFRDIVPPPLDNTKV